MVRLGFTMIELIFAIVIIGVSVMSLPTMTNIINKGIESNLVQEAIFAASTELMGASSGYWDENSMQDINLNHLSRVINISGDCDSVTKLRAGHIAQPYHRRCLNDLTTNAVSTAGGSVYDLDDASHLDEDIFIDNTTDASGYKQTYKSDIVVIQVGNIKKITATIKDENGDTITILRSQSANIGETDYYKRTL